MYGQQLKNKREEMHYTQGEVARATGISQANISRWESNTQDPAISFLVKIADLYGISVDELIDHTVGGGGKI